MAGLNVNAAEFVPNPNASVFVPGQQFHTGGSRPETNSSATVPSNSKDLAVDNEHTSLNSKVDTDDDHREDAGSNVNHQAKAPAAEMIESHNRLEPQPVESWEDAESSAGIQDDEDRRAECTTRAPRKPQKDVAEAKVKKEYINLVFVGHVDAGKSTIGGHIMFLTGMVDKRTLEKYEREAKEINRESWYLSWALDTNQEERDKGKTVEVGRAYFETERKHFTILDAPGHKSFVPNMIGGASQADLAVLVISARKGEFETGFERGGQTREHAMLVKTAGVRHLIILINKMDDPTVEWAEERYIECKDKLIPYLKKVGFNPKTEVTFIPCSGLNGAFLKDPAPESVVSWYRGPCFIEFIDGLPPISRAREGPVRIPLVDKYNDMGTVVLGKVESGTVVKGQNLILMPNKTQVQVINLYSDDDEVDDITPGENVKLKLKGVEEEDILSGFVLCSPDSPCRVGKVFDAQVVILECKSIISPGYSAVLHIHAAVEDVVVKALLCLVDRKTGDKSKERPRFVKQDQICIMRLECPEMFCLEPFKDFPQMGRFTLRDEGRTIAIGKVLKVVE